MKSGHNVDRTIPASQHFFSYSSVHKAKRAQADLEAILHDVRLAALDTYDCYAIWFHLKGGGDLVSEYWKGNYLPGLVDEEGTKLLHLAHKRGISIYGCKLPGGAEVSCKHRGQHLCVTASTGDKSQPLPFEREVQELLPHNGRGPLECGSVYTDRRCFYHAAIVSSRYAVANDRFFERRHSTFSDVRTPLNDTAPITLDELEHSLFPSHISTGPALHQRSNRASLVRFWLQGGNLHGTLAQEAMLCKRRSLKNSVFDVRHLLDAQSSSLSDPRNMYWAALPLLDKEVHFLADGSQHVFGNLKVTDLQHNLAKSHHYLPAHADLLEVSMVAHQLISRLLPTKAEALVKSISAFLLHEDETAMAASFVSRSSRSHRHGLSRRSSLTEEQKRYFDRARQHLVRGASRLLAGQEGQGRDSATEVLRDYEEEDQDEEDVESEEAEEVEGSQAETARTLIISSGIRAPILALISMSCGLKNNPERTLVHSFVAHLFRIIIVRFVKLHSS